MPFEILSKEEYVEKSLIDSEEQMHREKSQVEKNQTFYGVFTDKGTRGTHLSKPLQIGYLIFIFHSRGPTTFNL